MTTVEEAKSLISEFQPTRTTQQLSVDDSFGSVLATDVTSPIDMPPFPQSAMDGYALGEGPKNIGSKFKVVGEVAAGSGSWFDLGEGGCVRIFTGAAVPSSATTVVQQEWVNREGDEISLTNDVQSGNNIRPQGEQLEKGNIALEKGSRMNPAAIGFLNMLGVTEIDVYEAPKVAVLVTGNELVKSGSSLQYGQIYESNSSMLLSALEKEGVTGTTERVTDNLDETVTKISGAIDKNDVVILSGGISVGDHDHVGTAFKKLGVEEVFYKVAQKPGKPIFFGIIDGTAVFGLPGNPAASLVCFYEYVLPIIRKFKGDQNENLPQFRFPVAGGVIKKMPRSQFLKARVEGGNVHILEGQSSAMLNTFAKSNALAYIPANSDALEIGDTVEVHILP